MTVKLSKGCLVLLKPDQVKKVRRYLDPKRKASVTKMPSLSSIEPIVVRVFVVLCVLYKHSKRGVLADTFEQAVLAAFGERSPRFCGQLEMAARKCGFLRYFDIGSEEVYLIVPDRQMARLLGVDYFEGGKALKALTALEHLSAIHDLLSITEEMAVLTKQQGWRKAKQRLVSIVRALPALTA